MPPRPTRSGKPAWRPLGGELGLESLLGPALGFPGADTRRRGSRPSAGPARSAGAGRARLGVCACRSSRTHLGVGFVRLCTCAIVGAQGRADLRSRRPGEPSGSRGVTGETPEGSRVGASRGLCGPTGAGPGVLAPRPAPGVWDALGLARPGLGRLRRAPSLTRLPTGALATALSEEVVLSRRWLPALEHPSRGERHLCRAPLRVPPRRAGGRCSAMVPGRSRAHPFAPASASVERDRARESSFLAERCTAGSKRSQKDAWARGAGEQATSFPSGSSPRLPAYPAPGRGCIFQPRGAEGAEGGRRAAVSFSHPASLQPCRNCSFSLGDIRRGAVCPEREAFFFCRVPLG